MTYVLPVLELVQFFAKWQKVTFVSNSLVSPIEDFLTPDGAIQRIFLRLPGTLHSMLFPTID